MLDRHGRCDGEAGQVEGDEEAKAPGFQGTWEAGNGCEGEAYENPQNSGLSPQRTRFGCGC